MATAPTGVSRLQALEAILLNPELYWLAEEIPIPDPERGGRTRAHANFAYLLYEALISGYRSARQVEAELSHEVVWRFARRMVRKMFPDDRDMRLPGKPMRRHHWLRNSLQESPDRLGAGVDSFRTQNRPHGTGRDRDPEVLELSMDPSVAPGRVVLGEADHQVTNLCLRGRAALAPWARPTTRHDRAVPAEDRLGTDEKMRASGSSAGPGWRRRGSRGHAA